MALNKTKALLRSLISYLPRTVIRERLLRQKTTGVYGKWLKGSLLYADVSGFTAISEKLAQRGKEGAEELTHLMNTYFTAMLDFVFQYGGDVLLFGGDALVAFFEGHRHLLRTLRCALRMQAGMKCFRLVDTSQGRFRLEMRIGVDAGEVLLANLGEKSHRFHYLIAGETVQTLAQTESAAGTGQVAISAQTLPFIEKEGEAILSPGSDGFYLLRRLSARVPKHPCQEMLFTNESEKVVSTLGRYLPPGILTKLESDPNFGGVEGEHRLVTTLFVNFYGANDPNWKDEVIVEWLNQYLTAMQSCVSKYGGVIVRSDFAKKGHRLLILFGAPIAQENAGLHAVQCALEMQAKLKSMRHTSMGVPFAWLQRIGISTGNVFCGDVGSAERKEYTVMGDTVNLAARLMSVAGDGEILVDESTYRELENRITCQTLPPLSLKGKAELVPVYRVEGQRTFESPLLPKSTTPLVGRDSELGLLKEKAEQVRAGAGKIVAISGEAGIGKSRLVQALLEDGEQRGMRSVAGNCFSYTSGTPYFSWAQVLKSLLSIRASDGMQQQVRQLEAGLEALGEGQSRWVPILGEGLNIPVDENDLTQLLTPQFRQERFFDLTLQLLQTHAMQQPLMIVLEDAHFLDSVSLDLLTYLAHNIHQTPMLLIVASRTGLELPECESYAHYTALELKELSEAASFELIQSLLPPSSLSEPVGTLILEKARGNPLFVEGVAHSLLESGHLERDATTGQFQLASGRTELEVPDALNAMILSRLDRLPEQRRNMLRVAAVIGTIFFATTLRNIAPYRWEEEELYSELEVLESQAFLRLHQPAPVREYLFWHALVQEIAYETLSFARRRQLHTKVGAALERRFAQTLETVYERLAYHYLRSSERQKALEYCEKAGDKAKHLYANQSALDYYTQALKLVDTTTRRTSLYQQRGQVWQLIGDYDAAIADFQQMCCLARCMGDREREGEAILSLSSVFERKGDYTKSAKLAQEAIHISEEIENSQLVARGLRQLGNVDVHQGDYTQARQVFTASLQIYRELGDKQGITQSLNNLGVIAEHQGALNEARQLYTESLQIKRELGDNRSTVAVSLNNLGIIARRQGIYEEARQLYTESLQIYRELEDKYRVAQTLVNLGNIAWDQGTYHEARQLYTESLRIARELGNKQTIIHLLNNLGLIARNQGAYEEARQLLTESLQSARELGEKLVIAHALNNLGTIARFQGAYEEARQLHTESLQSARELGDKLGTASSLHQFGKLAEAEGDSAKVVLFLLTTTRLHKEMKSMNSTEAKEVQETLTGIQEKIDTEQFERIKKQAETISVDEVIELALA